MEVSDADLGWVVRRFRRRREDSPGADAGVRLEGGDAVRVEVRGGGSTAGGVQGFGWSCAVGWDEVGLVGEFGWNLGSGIVRGGWLGGWELVVFVERSRGFESFFYCWEVSGGTRRVLWTG